MNLALLALPVLTLFEPVSEFLVAVAPVGGQEVRVHLKGGSTAKGVLSYVTAESMVLRTKVGESLIASSDVRTVELRTGRVHRAKRGALIGGIAGGVLGAISVPLVTKSIGTGGAVVLAEAGLWAGVGAAIGASLPPSYKLVFPAP